MRIIINDKLLTSKRFNQLTKEQIVLLFQVASKFAECNGNEITATESYICAVFMAEPEDFRQLVNLDFISVSGKQMTLNEGSISFFKNNNANVQKCLQKKKGLEPVEAIKPVEVSKPVEVVQKPEKVSEIKQPEQQDKTDWSLVMAKFNDLAEGRQISKVNAITSKRQTSARNMFKIAKKLQDPESGEKYVFESFEDFLDQYFNIISERQGFVKGWTYNGKPWVADWDFFFKEKTLLNIIEKNMYN